MTAPQSSTIPQLTPEEAQRQQQAGALIIDVREPDEWAEGHIPGARHIPLGQLQQRTGELEGEQQIVAVCHSGRRSQMAAQALERAGFRRVANLAGGMVAWEQRHLPITR